VKSKKEIETTPPKKKKPRTAADRKPATPPKRKKQSADPVTVRVCMGLGGISAGGQEVLRAFVEEFERRGLTGEVGSRCQTQKVGCMGFCAKDVLVDVFVKDQKTTYQLVKPDMVSQIVEQHIIGGNPVAEWVAGPEYERFHQKQEKDRFESMRPDRPGSHRGLPGRGRLSGGGKGADRHDPGTGYPGD
jgi:(2Fe-2S) ferredoxin